MSIPALVMRESVLFLKIHGWLVGVCGLFTLILGLDIWVQTLRTNTHLTAEWVLQPASTQSLLQDRFNCCGFSNSTTGHYITSLTCPSDAVAVQRGTCAQPFYNYANGYLQLIFTASFGIVALDAIVVMCTAMLVKRRREKERYRYIDAKQGF
jgi:hypothetical protein